jgi:hypothetical protein
MPGIVTRYKNKKFVKERVELDGHAYDHCTFVECLIVLEKGETEIKDCVFQKSRLMLLGQALQIAKILQNFIGEKPLRVLDFAEPGIFGISKKSTTENAEIAEKD